MPTGNYEGPGWPYSEDAQRPFAITEPPDHGGHSSQSSIAREAGDEPAAVQAKEPDRQSASRRGSRRGHTSVESEYEEDRPRSARSSSRRSTQARRAAEHTQTAARRTAGPEGRIGRQKKSRRGFAAMSSEQQREIARKGGLTVSRNRRHMADIGRIGGEHSHGGRRARR
jgi:uncharacterized protein